jgi:hypothetical protein
MKFPFSLSWSWSSGVRFCRGSGVF